MEYLKEFKVLLMIGGECYESNFVLAFNGKDAKEKAKELFSPRSGKIVARSLGFAVDPQTHKKITRAKQFVSRSNIDILLRRQ